MRPVALPGWVLLGMIFLFVVVDPLLLTPLYTGVLLLVAGLCYFAFRSVGGQSLARYPGLWVILAAAAVSAAGAEFTWNPLEFLLVVATLVLLVPVLSTLRRDRFLGVLRWGLGIFMLVLLVPIVQQYVLQIRVLGFAGVLSVPGGSLVNPNLLGRTFGLAACFYLVSRENPFTSWLNPVLVGLFTMGVFWSGSRGAILAIVVAALTYCSRRWDSSLLLWGGLGVGVLLGLPFLVGRIEHVTNLQRIKLLVESVSMYLDHPITGVGGWNFGLEYPGYSLDGHWQRHPHSLPLWILTCFGSLGVGAAGYGVGALNQDRINWRWLPLLVFFLVHETVDTMVWVPGSLILTFLLLFPMVESQDSPPERDGGILPRMAIRGELLAVGMLILVGVLSVRTARAFNQGLEDGYRDRWTRADQHWSMVPTAFGTGHRALAQYKRGRTRRAIHFLKQAQNLNPLDPYYPLVLSRIEDYPDQQAARRQSRRLDPRDTLSLRNPPEQWGGGNYPETFQRTGKASIHWSKLRKHPRRAGWYIPFVDRAIRKSDCRQALRQIRVLLDYPELTRFTRIELESRRLTCYRMMGRTDRARATQQRLNRLRDHEPSMRATYHRFFYRRTGLDHAFFK